MASSSTLVVGIVMPSAEAAAPVPLAHGRCERRCDYDLTNRQIFDLRAGSHNIESFDILCSSVGKPIECFLIPQSRTVLESPHLANMACLDWTVRGI